MTAPSRRTPLTHTDGPDTERAAAISMVNAAQAMRVVVLEVFHLRRTAAGITDDEGAEYLRCHGYPDADRLTFGRRRHELALDGLVEDSGQRNATPSGRSAIVWRLVREDDRAPGWSAETIARALADGDGEQCSPGGS